MDENFADKQARMLMEIVDVFERNDANIIEMYRVLSIATSVAKEKLKETLAYLDEQVDSIMDSLNLLESE